MRKGLIVAFAVAAILWLTGCCTLSQQDQKKVAVYSSHHKVWDLRIHSWDT